MIINESKLKGVFEIQLQPIVDKRGTFTRTYDKNYLNAYGLHKEWVQENHSKTALRGTVRGLHFQHSQHAETKLVRCIQGAILNVFVDLRKDTETYGQWDAVELTSNNNKLLYIPKGFANGFCILSDNSEILYKTDSFYNPEFEDGIIWNDPDLNIKWPFSNPILSDKDSNNMSFSNFSNKYKYIY